MPTLSGVKGTVSPNFSVISKHNMMFFLPLLSTNCFSWSLQSSAKWDSVTISAIHINMCVIFTV